MFADISGGDVVARLETAVFSYDVFLIDIV